MSKLINLSIIGLLSLFLIACKQDNSPFKMKDVPENKTNDSVFSFAIQSDILPKKAEPTSLITAQDLPDNSIYLSVTSLDEKYFRINVHAKNIYNLNDLPLTIEYNPSLLSIGSTSENKGPIIGEELGKKIAILPSMNHVTVVGEPDPNKFNRYIISVNFLAVNGPPFNHFNGILFSLLCSSHPTINYDYPIGFVEAQSIGLDEDGNSLAVEFYGGTMSKR